MEESYMYTYIKTQNKEEFDKAIQFYESKWYHKDHNTNRCYSNWYDIRLSIEWIGCLSHKQTWILEWIQYKDITDEVFTNVDQLIEHPYLKWYYITYNEKNILPSLPKKTMSTLRTNIRNEFFNSQEKNLTKLVSNVEEKSSDIKCVLEKILQKLVEWESIIKRLEISIDTNDKERTKFLKKELEKFAVDLDDKLREQLLVIAKELVK